MKMVKQKKGVSPVIATVLLISIVVVLALIIFFWFRSFTKEAVLKFDKNIELVCEDVAFSGSVSETTIVMSNDGNVPLADVRVKISGAGGRKSVDLNLTEGVGVGKTITTENTDLSSAESILLIPVLRGTKNSGQENYVCDERYGVEVAP